MKEFVTLADDENGACCAMLPTRVSPRLGREVEGEWKLWQEPFILVSTDRTRQERVSSFRIAK